MVESVDRGGLTRVNDFTFELFWTMEKTLRDIMSASPVSRVPKNCIGKDVTIYLVSDEFRLD